MEKIYKPLYPEHGGPAQGFVCGSCSDVTRTKIGMMRHLWRKHMIKIQLDMDFEKVPVKEEELTWLDK